MTGLDAYVMGLLRGRWLSVLCLPVLKSTDDRTEFVGGSLATLLRFQLLELVNQSALDLVDLRRGMFFGVCRCLAHVYLLAKQSTRLDALVCAPSKGLAGISRPVGGSGLSRTSTSQPRSRPRCVPSWCGHRRINIHHRVSLSRRVAPAVVLVANRRELVVKEPWRCTDLLLLRCLAAWE